MDLKYLESKYKKYTYFKLNDYIINREIKNYAREKNMILYGGYAIHLLIQKATNNKVKIYDEYDLADIDVYSYDYLKESEEFAKILVHGSDKYHHVKIVSGIGGNTRRLFVNYSNNAIFDVTKIPDVYNLKNLQINNFIVCDPQYIKIDNYKIVTSFLFDNAFRVDKSMYRLQLLEKYYPVTGELLNSIEYPIESPDIPTEGDIIYGGDVVFNIYYKNKKNLTPSDGEELIIMNNGKNYIPVEGVLYKNNTRVMKLNGEIMHQKFKGKHKICSRLMLLYTYYIIRYYHNTHINDKKILKLTQDDKTWDMMADKLFIGSKPVTELIKYTKTQFIHDSSLRS